MQRQRDRDERNLLISEHPGFLKAVQFPCEQPGTDRDGCEMRGTGMRAASEPRPPLAVGALRPPWLARSRHIQPEPVFSVPPAVHCQPPCDEGRGHALPSVLSADAPAPFGAEPRKEVLNA